MYGVKTAIRISSEIGPEEYRYGDRYRNFTDSGSGGSVALIEGMDDPGKRSRIGLADGHQGLLEERHHLLSPEFEVVRPVREGGALIEAVSQLRPYALVSDINMPGLNGIEAARHILQQRLCDAVIMLTVFNEPHIVPKAIAAGVRGYILKIDAGEELAPAIHRVHDGHMYLSHGVSMTGSG